MSYDVPIQILLGMTVFFLLFACLTNWVRYTKLKQTVKRTEVILR